MLTAIRGLDSDDDSARSVSDELALTTQKLRTWLNGRPPADTDPDEVIGAVLEHIGPADLRRYTDSAGRGEDLDIIVDSFTARLTEVSPRASSWAQVFDDFESADAVALLTVHRSKGLEYHTVFFLGLDDQQWWSHQRDRDESVSAFFVGLSRAAQRLIFTTTSGEARRGRIADLYTMLDRAGVSEEKWK